MRKSTQFRTASEALISPTYAQVKLTCMSFISCEMPCSVVLSEYESGLTCTQRGSERRSHHITYPTSNLHETPARTRDF